MDKPVQQFVTQVAPLKGGEVVLGKSVLRVAGSRWEQRKNARLRKWVKCIYMVLQ